MYNRPKKCVYQMWYSRYYKVNQNMFCVNGHLQKFSSGQKQRKFTWEEFDQFCPIWLNHGFKWQYFNSWITDTLDGWLVAVWACLCQYEWLIRLEEQMGCGRHSQEARARNNEKCREKRLNEWDTSKTNLLKIQETRSILPTINLVLIVTVGREHLRSVGPH